MPIASPYGFNHKEVSNAAKYQLLWKPRELCTVPFIVTPLPVTIGEAIHFESPLNQFVKMPETLTDDSLKLR